MCTDLPGWDEGASELDITGLGDPFPDELNIMYPKHSKCLDEITQFVREISASQMYGAYQPDVAIGFLFKAAVSSGLELADIDLYPFYDSIPTRDGWGEPIKEGMLRLWKSTA